MLDLMLHCGASAVDRDAIDNVPTPTATESWFPIPHSALIDQVVETTTQSGLTVVRQAHGLSVDGAQYFGLLQVANGAVQEDYGLVLGIRNSHNKRFSASLALGAGVFVCDNLSFSGEVTLARKHTRHILRDLAGVVARAVGLLTTHRERQDVRIAAYKAHDVIDAQAHDVVVNALDCQAISATKIPAVLKAWREPPYEEFRPRTAWSLFNAFTEVYKGSGTAHTLKRSQALHGLLDSTCGLHVT